MSKQDFVRNNRGINDNSDLPEDFLGSIFDEISRNEIVMEEERTVKELQKMISVGISASARELEEQRRVIFRRETKVSNSDKKD
jgi:Sec7-like guanine-nucleotide exchange factor